MERIVERLFNIYDEFFVVIILTILMFVGFQILLLHQKKSGHSREGLYSWHYFWGIANRELIKAAFEIVLLTGFFIIIANFLKQSFNIDIVATLQLHKSWKLIFALWFVLHLKSIFSSLKYLENSDFLDTIEDENRLLDSIDDYQIFCEVAIQRLDLLKHFAPVSLLPLLAGYILEGNNFIINWNYFTTAIFVAIVIYFYFVVRTYNKIKHFKSAKGRVLKRLRTVQSQKS